jgi:tetratricopeptide (TPR) repeat protein
LRRIGIDLRRVGERHHVHVAARCAHPPGNARRTGFDPQLCLPRRAGSTYGERTAMGPTGTDLVAELHHEHDESIRQLAQRKRAQRRRRVIFIITGVVLLVVAGVAAKLGFDAYRHARALEAAHEHLDKGTPEDLTAAAADLDRALGIRPQDEEGRALLALVRAHESVISGDTAAVHTALEGLDTAPEPEAKLARGMTAALDGDLDAAATILGELDAVDGKALRRGRAWLVATLALADPYDDEAVAKGIAALEATVDEDPWAPGHRFLAALLARAGRMDDALARLTAAREKAASDLGIAADEAVLHALVAQHDDGVVEVTASLIDGAGLSDRARGRAVLARAIVHARRGEDDAQKLRARAWELLPAWDRDSRDLAVTAAFLDGDVETGKKWLDTLDLGDDVVAIYSAWDELLQGDETGALERCAKLDQARPRVAYVQALALAEQQRWAEATPWIDRAETRLGNLVELRVARHRAAAHAGDPKAAIEALDDLADEYPHASRVFTGLGEAHLAQWTDHDKDPPEEATKVLKRALDKEARPAEAAYLLGTIYQHAATAKPSRAGKALEMFAKAVELREGEPRFRIAYGEYLATHGDETVARKVLRPLAEVEPSVGQPLVTLASLEILHARETGKKLPAEDIEAWLTKAVAGGASADSLVRARVSLALARDPGPVPAAVVAELSALLSANPKDIDSRVLHSETLLRVGDFDTARASLRFGIDKTLKVLDGRLYLAWARVERADKGDRLAASLAYKGWRKAEAEPRPPNELLRFAEETAEMWGDIDNTDVPRTIGQALTKRVPYRAAAWAFRAEAQARDGHGPESCTSADKALELDEKLAASHAARAECYISRHEYPKARTELDKAIRTATRLDEVRRYKRRRRVIR